VGVGKSFIYPESTIWIGKGPVYGVLTKDNE